MKTSLLTKKKYDEGNCIYMSNPQQCFFYLNTIGYDHLVDLLYDSSVKERMLVFVWERCKETAECKRLWDEKGKNRIK